MASKNRLLTLLTLVHLTATLAQAQPEEKLDHTASETLAQWPAWRGPLQTGAAPLANPPINWSENPNKNIRWKTPIPGLGHSTPIIWGNHIFLTAAVPFGEKRPPRFSGAPGAHDNLPVSSHHRFLVIALNRQTGKILWQRTATESLPHEGGHVSGSLASASPVTDGHHIFAFFGSHGLYCYDFDGKLIWKASLGKMHTKHGHGEGSSPALHGDTLIVNWDHEGQSKVVAFDTRSGKPRWQQTRNEVTSWATPLIVKHKKRAQVIIPGTARLRSYDLQTGKILWQCGGLSANIVATPVAAGGMVFAGSSYEKRVLLAIRLDTLQGKPIQGDITGTGQVVWQRHRGTPYVPSPLLYDNSLYFLRHYQGILTRLSAKTGKEVHAPLRLPGLGNIYASPIAAAGRIYITDTRGATLVLSHAPFAKNPAPKVLSLNRLDEPISASLAAVGSQLFLRGNRHLYCIAKKNSKQ